MIAERPRASLRASAMSSARCTKDSAIQATPSDIAYSRSARSFSVIEPKGSTVSGRLMPLRLPSNPLVITSASILTSLASTTRSLSLPSSSRSVWPGLTACEDLGMRQVHAAQAADRLAADEAQHVAFGQPDGAGVELADAELGALQVDQDADRPREFGLELAHRSRGCRASRHASHGSYSRETRRRPPRTGGASFLRCWRQDRAWRRS